MKKFVELEEAIEILNSNINALDTEYISVSQCTGRYLVEDVHSTINNPPFNKSAMDGYAIIADDENSEMQIIGKVYAGQVFDGAVQYGTAVRIMTGAPIPKGANAVIKQEDVEVIHNGKIIIKKQIREHENICFKGEDIKKGTLLVKKDKPLDFADVGIIASSGIKVVHVYKKPKIAFISTGDEVVDVDESLSPGKIYNSNKYTIIARLRELGYDIHCTKHVSDIQNEIGEYIKTMAKEADLIITTGGVSVGEKDLLNEVIEDIGGCRLFWKVKIKPGSAVLCSMMNKIPIISLSGNPTAALTGFELFVKGALEKLCGKQHIEITREKAVLSEEILKSSPQRRYIRARYCIDDAIQKVCLTQIKSGNGILSSNLNSNCMIELEAGNQGECIGSTVNIIKF